MRTTAQRSVLDWNFTIVVSAAGTGAGPMTTGPAGLPRQHGTKRWPLLGVEDFTTGLAEKLSTWLVNTDENVTKHGLVDKRH